MNRISVVTGGTRGIGLAIAEALLRAGDRVALTGTSSDGLQQAVSGLTSRGVDAANLLPVVCDVRESPSVEDAFAEVDSRFGGVDVLVNNAGVGVFADIADLSDEDWHRVIDTNLTGVFNCSKAAIPYLRRRGGGWIINVSSLASKNPFVGGAAYCASKAGLNAFSEALMQELRHDKIRVSYILPGSVATGFSGRVPSTGGDWKLQPEDIAEVVVDLLAHPARSLPSRVEIRPSRPQK